MKKENILSNNQNKNLNNKEDEIMKREEIKTEIEEILEKIYKEKRELKYFKGDLIYKDYNTNIISKSYDYINDSIWDFVDNEFIYYSDTNEFLKNYDIFKEIKNYEYEFGITPENKCQLAAYILQNEIYNNDYDTIEKIDKYIDKIEELQEELDELEEEPGEEVER